MKTSLALTALFTLIAAAPAPTPNRDPTTPCNHHNHFHGWPRISHLIVFGDSYTTTAFNPSLTQPSAANPFGNPAYPGSTSSNGPNWIDFLATTHNASFIETVNLASGGATVDGSIVPVFSPTIKSVRQQIEEWYLPIYAEHPASFDWRADDTLFVTFIGINDVNNAYRQNNSSAVFEEDLAEYAALVEELYTSGARNFLLLNVPPIDRSPGTISAGAHAQAQQALAVAAWNGNVSRMVDGLQEAHGDATAFVFDTNALYSEVLDDPCAYEETCGYRDTVEYCADYQLGTAAWDMWDPNCAYAVNEYFWLNWLHPTYPVHNATAHAIARMLSSPQQRR